MSNSIIVAREGGIGERKLAKILGFTSGIMMNLAAIYTPPRRMNNRGGNLLRILPKPVVERIRAITPMSMIPGEFHESR